jgi:hypothetical protein
LTAFGSYIVSHWPLLLLALFTGSFTWHAADYYLGNPLYTFMTLVLTEGMFMLWAFWAEGAVSSGMEDNKLETSEKVQITAAVLGVFIAFVAMLLTDFASAQILAVESKMFTTFTQIPAWAQSVIVNIVWVLAIVNVLLVGVYLIASPQAALMRAENRSQRMMERARIQGEIKKQKAAADEYARLANNNAQAAGKQLARDKFSDNFGRSFAQDVATNPEGDDAQGNFTPPRSTR